MVEGIETEWWALEERIFQLSRLQIVRTVTSVFSYLPLMYEKWIYIFFEQNQTSETPFSSVCA